MGFSLGTTEVTALGGFTYGIGTEFGRQIFVNLDLIYSALWGEATTISGGANASGGTFAGDRLQPRASLGWQVLPRFAIYASASETLWFTTLDTALGPGAVQHGSRDGSLWLEPIPLP